MRIERRRCGPRLARVLRSGEHEIAVRVGVRVFFIPEQPTIRRASKREQQLPIGPAHHGRERVVESRVFIDDDVLELPDGADIYSYRKPKAEANQGGKTTKYTKHTKENISAVKRHWSKDPTERHLSGEGPGSMRFVFVL